MFMMNEEHPQIPLRTIAIETLTLVLLYAVGIFVYHTIEGWSYVDSAYFITVTITTIGYGDLVPKTDVGKIFTIFVAFTGISLHFC